MAAIKNKISGFLFTVNLSKTTSSVSQNEHRVPHSKVAFCATLEWAHVYSANRFKNEKYPEISANRPITSRMPNAISNPPLATSSACM